MSCEHAAERLLPAALAADAACARCSRWRRAAGRGSGRWRTGRDGLIDTREVDARKTNDPEASLLVEERASGGSLALARHQRLQRGHQIAIHLASLVRLAGRELSIADDQPERRALH